MGRRDGEVGVVGSGQRREQNTSKNGLAFVLW